ncbi:MAG: hypothetical protein ACKV2T_06310 [Kofleriaceae bacterium]
MKRLTGFLLCVAAAGLIGCGDNGAECGEGTVLDDGFCVPTGTTVSCSDGTILDETTNTCVIDPASCQAGTVLIDGACVDPTAEVTVDVTEAVEPNALGFFGEPSDDPAGDFMLKAVGGAAVVLQGNLNPQADRDDDGEQEADFDTYLFDAAGPTLLEISVDGVGGAAGAFAILNGDSESLLGWVRFGVNRLGDTGKRQVYLPQGGIYILVVSDTRSFVQSLAVGDANNKYYASIKQLAVPTSTALTVTGGVARALDTLPAGEVKLYTAPFGQGLNDISYLIDNLNIRGSIVVTENGGARAVANEDGGPAFVQIGGIAATDNVLVVADQLINTNGSATAFDLQITVGSATALPTNGTTAMVDNATDASDFFPSSFAGLSALYFDVNGTGDTVGLDLSWNVPVDGILLDENGSVVNNFSYDPNGVFFSFFDGFGYFQWEDYEGLFRAPAAGRYYLFVWGPQNALGDDLIVTSTITAVTPGTLTAGTPLTAQVPNAFNSNPYNFNADNVTWERFTAQADTASGGALVEFYARDDAFGRLDNLVLEDLLSLGDFSDSQEVFPVFSYGSAANSNVERGQILLGGPTQYYAKVNTIASAGTFGLGADARMFSDLGTHQGPYTTTLTAQTFPLTYDDGGDHFGLGEHYYLLRTAPGTLISITVTPSDAGMDALIGNMDFDESFFDLEDDGLTGPETYTYTMDSFGFIAFSVWDWVEVAGGTFDMTITLTAPTVTANYYTAMAGATTWSNACSGGQDVTPLIRDDGFTNAITIPAGFDFFANPVTAIKISTNGWFTFNTDDDISASQSRNPQRLPSSSAPNGLVAAYWRDLDVVRICTKTVGTKFIVQWRGVVWNTEDIIAAQAILDTADDSIEIVHAPYTSGTGVSASSGVESSTGSQGTSLFFNSNNADLAGTATKLRHL